ncbi:MAG TPA: DUF885 domain-containing protein [Actinomycetota bacterium]|nr:DUF885 domain-containing protein [Actinomycetota bacterium]
MTTADAVRVFVDRYWEQLLELDPILGTMVGDERYDDRLPDPSEEGRARSASVHRAALAELASFDRDIEDDALRTSLDMAEAISLREVASIDHRLDRLWAVSHFWGPAQLLGELGAMQRADTPERLERYLARLSATPAFYHAVREVTRDGAAAGVTAPRVVVERTLGQLERFLTTPVEESPALGPVPEQDTAGRERVAEVLRTSAMPALEAYRTALREYLPDVTETIGLSALPGGEAMYAAEILAWTSLPLEAQKVHDLGVEDLERIEEERRLAADRLGYGSPAEAEADLLQRHPFASKEELKDLAEGQVRRGWEAAPSFFGRIPRDNCEVRSVEEFREADMAFAFYQPPSEDGSRPGIYYVNGYDLPSRPRHHLATTTYHEANPGHHFQISIEQEMGDRPALRRFGGLLSGSAFAEGWGLYSERLADEMGLFLDEAERLGMLDAQAHRAARLIVDTGMHALGWTRERSIATLASAGVPHTDAVIETDRYITLPGQALSYKIGQFEIERQREEAAKREGAAFTLPSFHDRLLALGSLPLPALQRELRSR